MKDNNKSSPTKPANDKPLDDSVYGFRVLGTLKIDLSKINFKELLRIAKERKAKLSRDRPS
ncbi:MAG: hypothetical protein ABJH28_10260 [Paraglaciecola sp.]|uniref:hypothetical protein n=1 Tax=Paraglaciecola sp. TaxID=1920173 RepID=UPI003265A0A3